MQAHIPSTNKAGVHEENFHPKRLEYYENVKSLELALSTGRKVVIAYNICIGNGNPSLKYYPISLLASQKPDQLVIAYQRPELKAYALRLAELVS